MPGKECQVDQCPYPQGCVLENQNTYLGLENTSAVPPARRFQQLGCPKADTIIYSSRQPSQAETQVLMEQAGFRPLWDNPRPYEEHAKRILASYGEPREFYENLSLDQLTAEVNKRQELASQISPATRSPKTTPDSPSRQKGQFTHAKPGEKMQYKHPQKSGFHPRKTQATSIQKAHP